MADNPFDVVYGNGRYGSPVTPVTQSTISQLINWGRNVLIPATRGKIGAGPNQGTSAVGAFQFTQGTLSEYGPKVLGSNWRNVTFTPEVQDRLAEQLFNDRKGGNLKDTWASLPDARPGAYANTPWERMRQIIARGEVSATLPDLTRSTNTNPGRSQSFTGASDFIQGAIAGMTTLPGIGPVVGMGSNLLTDPQGTVDAISEGASKLDPVSSIVEFFKQLFSQDTAIRLIVVIIGIAAIAAAFASLISGGSAPLQIAKGLVK